MCFGGGSKPVPPPAPAPPAPEALPTPTDVGEAQKQQEKNLYGTSTPDLRINRTDTTPTGGSGVKM